MTKNKNGVQGLIGLERFTRFGVKTDKAEIAFFSVEPTNISVLSAAKASRWPTPTSPTASTSLRWRCSVWSPR